LKGQKKMTQIERQHAIAEAERMRDWCLAHRQPKNAAHWDRIARLYVMAAAAEKK
jgi:hypothetical protein